MVSKVYLADIVSGILCRHPMHVVWRRQRDQLRVVDGRCVVVCRATTSTNERVRLLLFTVASCVSKNASADETRLRHHAIGWF